MEDRNNNVEPVTITLTDGQSRLVVYTLGSLKRIRTHPDAKSEDGLQRLDVLGFMLHEGLRGGGDSSITVEQVEDLMDVRQIPYIDRKIQDAMSASNAAPKNDAPAAVETQPAATEASTSSKSGPSEDSTSASPAAPPESSQPPERSGG